MRGKTRRTDGEVIRDVVRAMKADFDVPDDRIVVSVSDGIAILEGAVRYNSQREAAERCASRVCGVRKVVNRIDLASAAELLRA
jgi:osmotically-inducible protein OsmY